MAKRKSAAGYMTPGEQIAGTVFFVIYLLVLPFAAGPIFDLAARVLGTSLSQSLRSAVYYGLLAVTALVIFHGFLGRTTRNLMDNLGSACKGALGGIVALYGLNELVYRLSHLLTGNQLDLNDSVISAQIQAVPQTAMVIVVLASPFVEEVLFRGLVFGNLRNKGRVPAYLISGLLFAFLHLWQFVLVHQDTAYFLVLLQYLVPGLALAGVYEYSGTLWSSIAVHAAVNALAWLL